MYDWMYYSTKDMAKASGSTRPYINLKTYLEYKERGIEILEKHKSEILSLSEEEDRSIEIEENNEE